MVDASSCPAVLITGGANRIGAELCRGFAAKGWHVVIHYHSSDDAARALARTLPSAEIAQCDLADGDAASQMIADLADSLPNWQCLINSAAVFQYDDAARLNPAVNMEAMQVNARSPALMAQLFLERARSTANRTVIHVTDMKLENPNPDFFSYTMAKHALASTIPMLSIKGCMNDRIYGIAPGAILPSHDQRVDEIEVSHRMNLLGRKTGCDEIVDAALFLATGALKSGSTLFVDSGQHLLSQNRDVIWLARGNSGARA